MTEAEKQKKLLEIAGVSVLDLPWSKGIWYYIDETVTNKPPDLLGSLDAQEQWLWPKIEGLTAVEFQKLALGWGAEIEIASDKYNYHYGRSDTPARAFADAVLKMIEDRE